MLQNWLTSFCIFRAICLLAVIFILKFPNSVFSQNGLSSIEGYVFNKQTNEPIQDVNVYLSNSIIGVATKNDGSFRLQKIPPGNYELVFSHVGFKQKILSISIREAEFIHFDEIFLDENIIQLDELEVIPTEDNREWRRELQEFERAFIGSSFNARQTTLKNPEVLSFERAPENNFLMARAVDELHFVNKSLGYELFVSLVDFSWNTEQNNGDHLYATRFKKMEPENLDELSKWIENRRKTYKGSFHHFRHSLLDGSFEENFEVTNGSLKMVGKETIQPENEHFSNENTYTIISYKMVTDKEEEPLKLLYGDVYVEIHTRYNNYLLLDSFGNVLNPENIILGGFWRRYRIADLLPIHYEN